MAFECDARVSIAPADVAATLGRLLANHEPGAHYLPLRDDDVYGQRLRRLASIELSIVRVEAKFKVGPAAPPEDARARVVRGLRQRNAPGDTRAADVIQAAIDNQR